LTRESAPRALAPLSIFGISDICVRLFSGVAPTS
jgi:hypothetical protein